MGAKLEFENCLKKNGIRPFARAASLVDREIETATCDLKEATKGFVQGSYKWSTIQSYYSMFHSARALLYAKGYREKGHYCLRVAIEVLYVEPGLLQQRVIDALQAAKELRENADYENNFSEIGARKLISAAQELLDTAKELVEK